jgi:hypothetical protein
VLEAIFSKFSKRGMYMAKKRARKAAKRTKRKATKKELVEKEKHRA